MKRPIFILSSRIAFAALLCATASQIQAAISTWDNGNGNFQWSTSANWNPNSEPNNGDDVIFNATGVGTINLGVAERAKTLTFNVNGYTLTGNSIDTNSGDITVATGVTARIDSQLTGSGATIKQGLGTLILGGNNTVSGATSINAGTLIAASSTALGTIGIGTTVSSGATLGIQGNVSIGAEPLNLNGTGVAGIGALNNVSGNNSFAGPITLSGATTISSTSGLLTLDVASGNAIGGAFALTVAGAGDITVNDPIANITSLTKNDSGILTLNGANTYTGTTTINAGTFILNGSLSGALVVSGAATIGGTGTFGAFSVGGGGTISPNGTNSGILNTGSLTLNGGGNYDVNINGTTLGSQYDQVNITGSLSFSANIALNINLGSFDPLDNGSQSFTIVNNDGTDLLTGGGLFTVAGVPIGNGGGFVVSGQNFIMNYFGGTGGNDVIITAVPEPGSVAMLLGGFGVLLGVQRIRRRRAA